MRIENQCVIVEPEDTPMREEEIDGLLMTAIEHRASTDEWRENEKGKLVGTFWYRVKFPEDSVPKLYPELALWRRLRER